MYFFIFFASCEPLIKTFLYHADEGWFEEKYFQENLSGPFTNAKTQELPRALPPDPRGGSAPWHNQGPFSGPLDPTPLDTPLASLAQLSWIVNF